jgi:hypothetical protein
VTRLHLKVASGGHEPLQRLIADELPLLAWRTTTSIEHVFASVKVANVKSHLDSRMSQLTG